MVKIKNPPWDEGCKGIEGIGGAPIMLWTESPIENAAATKGARRFIGEVREQFGYLDEVTEEPLSEIELPLEMLSDPVSLADAIGVYERVAFAYDVLLLAPTYAALAREIAEALRAERGRREFAARGAAAQRDARRRDARDELAR